MADLPEGTDRGTLVLVQTKEEGQTEPTQFVVGAGYLEAFGDEVEFVRFASETADAAEAREKAAAKPAAKASATQGSGGSGRSDF